MHAYIVPDGPFCGDREEHVLEAKVLAADRIIKPDADEGEMGNDSANKDGADMDCTDKDDAH